ncbi:hypothetical protein TSUD_337150 [Trifolium subterraneum]|uniref:Uncharacterized protein n=1 Tax=Trifolium subterraneum TaxID=3900 RepID=A0A2Z6MZQ5_TRISU|nr:hypothetical protein TSUD_337150 [Trifolium subterraneum]
MFVIHSLLPASTMLSQNNNTKCWISRVQPRLNSSLGCWWVAIDIPRWKLRALRLCTEDHRSKKKEASLKKEDEKGETEARRLHTRRVELLY